MNKLVARAMRARMTNRTDEACNLEAELQRAKAALAQACYTPLACYTTLACYAPLGRYVPLACHTPSACYAP